MRFDLNTSLVLFLEGVGQSAFNKLADMIDMPTTFGRGNGVDKGHLLESIVRRSDCYFPTFATFFIDAFDLVARFICVSFQDEVDIILECKMT